MKDLHVLRVWSFLPLCAMSSPAWVDTLDNANAALPAQTDSCTRTAGTNKLSSIDSTFGTPSIAYDARGNIDSESRSGGITVTIGYGRLTSCARTSEVGLVQLYNGLG